MKSFSFFSRHCLDLIDDPTFVVNERNLIECQTICDYFHYSITPLESKSKNKQFLFRSKFDLVRRHPNPFQLIQSILQSNSQAYLNPSKVSTISLCQQSLIKCLFFS